MSHQSTVKGDNPCQPPDILANVGYNSGLPLPVTLREDDPILRESYQKAGVEVLGEPLNTHHLPNLTYLRLLIVGLAQPLHQPLTPRLDSYLWNRVRPSHRQYHGGEEHLLMACLPSLSRTYFTTPLSHALHHIMTPIRTKPPNTHLSPLIQSNTRLATIMEPP